MLPPMSIQDPKLAAIFQPDAQKAPRALVVAGACGNVGFGKLGQFARILSKHGVPVVALDLSDAVHGVKDKLQAAFAKKFAPDAIEKILAGVTVVQGGIDDLPQELEIGFVFEAIPEKLSIKQPFYAAIRKRDRDPQHPAYIFSATSGITTRSLYEGLEHAGHCGVLHPFFPHLTNKLWEMPTRDCVTSKETLKTVSKFLGGFGMSVIEVSDVAAFAADRIFCGMMLEAVRIHATEGLSPAQVDDACKKLLGTSPFFVHNLIPGANYLSGHCMELCGQEVESTLFEIPEVWRPYFEDPKKQWPYERGEKCPPEKLEVVRERMFGMLFSLSAYMIEHNIAGADVLNFLCENALAFRTGVPALIAEVGAQSAVELTRAFLSKQSITHADTVAPLSAIAPEAKWLGKLYVSTAVHDGVGLLSLKRRTVNHIFAQELGDAYDELAANDAVQAIVIAPDGKMSREFGHGADPNAFVPVLGNHEAALSLIQAWKSSLSKLRGGPKPTVAALVGRVLGGGMELASSCDARIAAQKTVLGQPETTVGVVPGLGGCHLMHRFSKAEFHERINELLLTGHSFSAEEAQSWGLVSKVVPVAELAPASMAFAKELGEKKVEKPAFRSDGLSFEVKREVSPQNEAGVALDADLRELLAQTIQEVNALPFAQASKLEEERAAKSLTMSSSKIGVKALLRGKPPEFEKPLGA